MASAFSHAASALALTSVFAPGGLRARFYALAILLSILPDFDVISFRLGIAYENPYGHRGFTHSIFFSILLAFMISWLLRKHIANGAWLRLAFCFSLVIASHGFLDALTNGGKGIAFFWPFDNGRYFLPWRVIQVSPVTIHQFFSEWGRRVIINETGYIILPSLCIFGAAVFIRP